MEGRTVDLSVRNKEWSFVVRFSRLPVTPKQMAYVLGGLGHVMEDHKTREVIYLDDEDYEEDVPQAILMAASEKGIYMELNYAMDDFGWDHPLLLAHDHLSEEDAAGVLVAILDACTDNVSVIQKEFRDITGWVYEDKETGDKSQA